MVISQTNLSCKRVVSHVFSNKNTIFFFLLFPFAPFYPPPPSPSPYLSSSTESDPSMLPAVGYSVVLACHQLSNSISFHNDLSTRYKWSGLGHSLCFCCSSLGELEWASLWSLFIWLLHNFWDVRMWTDTYMVTRVAGNSEIEVSVLLEKLCEKER